MNEVVETLGMLVESQRQPFNRVVSVKGIEFDREAQFALQILGSNDYIRKIAMSNKTSLFAAINNVAAIGISLNPASKLAYLVPRKGAICLDISYIGVMHIAMVSTAIKWGQSKIVRETDTFELNGVDKPPTHTYNPFDTKRGNIIGCYVVVKTDEGDYLTHSMPIADIESIRNRSESWIARMKKIAKKEPPTQTPWETDFEEMAKKTVVKQASKYWPRREHLDNVVHYLNDPETEGIDFRDVTQEVEREDGLKPIRHSAVDDALPSMKANEQDRAREIATKVRDLLDEGYDWQAHDLVYAEENEFRTAIWAALGSEKYKANDKMVTYRGVITKYHDEELAGKRPEPPPPEL